MYRTETSFSSIGQKSAKLIVDLSRNMDLEADSQKKETDLTVKRRAETHFWRTCIINPRPKETFQWDAQANVLLSRF